MAKNKIDDLRDHLFETLERLKDKDNPIDIERAEAITKVAQTIINSAKVEVDLVRAVGASGAGSTFFDPKQQNPALKPPLAPAVPKQITGKGNRDPRFTELDEQIASENRSGKAGA